VLAAADAFPDAPAADANVMTGRVLAYPFAVVVVPLAWLLVRRARPGATYPYALDVLVVLPFLGDAASAVAGFHERVWWWDELGHVACWAVLVAGVTLLLVRRTELPPAAAAGLGIGFGAVTAILWELAEFLVFLRHTTDPMLSYTDTLSDMALGLAGSTAAAVGVVLAARAERADARATLVT